MHPSAGGPPVVVENAIRETNTLGQSSEIISTQQFCMGDEAALLHRLNMLAPTFFLAQSGFLATFHSPTKHQIRESIRAADVVHLHTLWNPLNIMVRRECAKQ